MRVRRFIVFASISGAVTVTALEGCSGGNNTSGDVCNSPAACNKAPSPSTAEVNQCNTLVADAKCGSQYRAMKECQTYRAQCTTSGTVNSSATNVQCQTEINAYSQCTRTNVDGGPDACRARTCASVGATCGEIDNGCGTKIQCGTCTGGQTCGTNNRCGCTCDPTWCGTLTACGTTITCPATCASPQWCGGGGVANRCGCAPSGSVGPLVATSVTTATIALDGGTQSSWSGASNARASDNAFASASMAPNVTSQYLVALGFNVGLPPTATITGIVVQVERSSTLGLATADAAVYLVKNTQIQTTGQNKAQTGVVWPVAETTATYGGPTDTWGGTWTAADVNANGFGVAFAATYGGQTGSEQARVDSIRVVVHWSGVSCP